MEKSFRKIISKADSYHQRKLLNLYSNTKISENGCWVWTKAKDKNGYGITSFGGKKVTGFFKKNVRAHRLIYHLLKGPIPNGMYACHTCDNPSCIHPKHIFLGTSSDNAKDRETKQRSRSNYGKGEKNPQHKLTENDVLLIRKLYSEGIYACEISKHFKISPTHVTRLVGKGRWKHI